VQRVDAVALLELEKAEWRSFFDLAPRCLIGKRAEIEVASLPSATRSLRSGSRCERCLRPEERT